MGRKITLKRKGKEEWKGGRERERKERDEKEGKGKERKGKMKVNKEKGKWYILQKIL